MAKKQKNNIVFDKNIIKEQAYNDYKYLVDYMIVEARGNYNTPGNSDYPIYGYLSSLVDNTTILEIGTNQGGSAVMLTSNLTNKIISYDICKLFSDNINRNIEFRIGNFMEDDIDYSSIDIMTLDVDPHDGVKETEMWSFLENKWKGGLIYLDDIHNGSGMENFWNSIDSKHEKWDLTDVGHGFHGSGLVNFNKYFNVTFIE